MQSTLIAWENSVFVLDWLNLGTQNPFTLQHVSQLSNPFYHLRKVNNQFVFLPVIYDTESMETKLLFYFLIWDLNVYLGCSFLSFSTGIIWHDPTQIATETLNCSSLIHMSFISYWKVLRSPSGGKFKNTEILTSVRSGVHTESSILCFTWDMEFGYSTMDLQKEILDP